MGVYLLIKINPDAYLACHLLSSDDLLINYDKRDCSLCMCFDKKYSHEFIDFKYLMKRAL
mgnify:CR=1 FL=1